MDLKQCVKELAGVIRKTLADQTQRYSMVRKLELQLQAVEAASGGNVEVGLLNTVLAEVRSLSSASTRSAPKPQPRRAERDDDPDRSEGPDDRHDFMANVMEAEADSRDYVVVDFGGGVTMKLVRIPAGQFDMGSPSDEPKRRDNETFHPVRITQPFYMGEHPVTQAQYEAIMGANPSLFRGATRPVENVSWGAARKLCDRLAGKTGMPFSLPTEAQWECACRAGSQGSYCFGDDRSQLLEFARFAPNSGFETHPVGALQANAFGLYDMHGNVWEWCSDWYGDHPEGPVDDPTGPPEGVSRVVRGGGCGSTPKLVRSAYRNAYAPGNRGHDLGFRLARGQ